MAGFFLHSEETKRAIKNLLSAVSDLKKPLGEVERFQKREIESQFSSEGAHITSRWAPLAPSTIAQRIRKGFGAGPILTASGKMRKSNKRKKLNKNTLQIENRQKYFKYHQSGTGRMPRRQVYGHSRSMIQKTLDIIEKYIISKIKP